MAAVDLKSLVGRLDAPCRSALEEAAALAVTRTHFNIEIEHWLAKLIGIPNGDAGPILDRFGIDRSRLEADLTRTLDGFKTGNTRAPSLSPTLVSLARDAWLTASLEFGAARIRSGHVLLALVSDQQLALAAREASPQLARLQPEALKAEFHSLTGKSVEAVDDSPAAAASQAAKGGGGASPGGAPTGGGKALEQFTIDLTARGRAGAIDPVLGRDAEIRQIVDILTRRRQNNPILTGEAGVGKTAVVEGFALRIAAGDVPPALRTCAVRTLDLGLLQAGAGVRGEFENRLKQVIEEVRASPQPIILFIDEAHTLIGAGGQAGQGDAANLLKPALARGDLRTIAATTWAEYKKYFERDAALARRFQVVKVDEPAEPVAVEMMRGLVETLEQHHGVRILDEAVVDAVRLSHRYITGRQLPDKSVSLLDTACARVAVSQSATPPQIEDLRRRIEQLDVAIGIADREAATDSAREAQAEELRIQRGEAADELARLETRWEEEKTLVDAVSDLRRRIEDAHGRGRVAGSATEPPVADGPVPASVGSMATPGDSAAAAPPDPEEVARWREELASKTAELRAIQGESPLLQSVVDGAAVAAVVAGWTGIPVGRMVTDEINTVLSLERRMGERIVGQDHGLNVIAEAMRTSRAKLTDPRKPIGVFLLVGTSGVGKTETALTLAELLYGGQQNLTTINMSEFKEEHKVSLLMGSPPGYVGYGEGGVLTEAVRRRPYSVVLLDEMEKAHPGVQDVFYQVFDKGMLRDGEGRDIDFKNTVIIMTSNAGTDTIAALAADPETMPDANGLLEALRPELLKVFKPAFLGRVTVVPYFPLSEEMVKAIARLQLERVRQRVADSYGARFDYDEAVVDAIASRATESESGARNIESIITRSILPELSARFLALMAEGGAVTSVTVHLGENGAFEYVIA